MSALATALLVLLVWSAVSRPLDARGITSALFLMASGLIVALVFPGSVDIALEARAAETVAEIALVLLLFSDATRLDLEDLDALLGPDPGSDPA